MKKCVHENSHVTVWNEMECPFDCGKMFCFPYMNMQQIVAEFVCYFGFNRTFVGIFLSLVSLRREVESTYHSAVKTLNRKFGCTLLL
jgi:hypothetical protein